VIKNDVRGGRPFIELVHDSFIEPILKANRDWKEKRARQVAWLNAALEYAETRNPALLIRGGSLDAAQEQSRLIKDLPKEADEYLAASLEAEERRADEARSLEAKRQFELERERAETAEAARIRQRKLTKLMSAVGAVALIVGIMAVIAFFDASRLRQVAENNAKEAGNAEATAVAARATANAARVAADNNSDEARLAEREAESLRIAEKVDGFYENGNIVGALLTGFIAFDINQNDITKEKLEETLSLASAASLGPEYENNQNEAAMLEMVCSYSQRNLTAGEWEEIFPSGTDVDNYLKYQEICIDYSPHISLAEHFIRQCKAENLYKAQRIYHLANIERSKDFGQPGGYQRGLGLGAGRAAEEIDVRRRGPHHRVGVPGGLEGRDGLHGLRGDQ
jgi:hypothetical protein